MSNSNFGNPVKARDLLFDMFLNYVRQDDFGNLSDDARREVVDQVYEMKNTMIVPDITGVGTDLSDPQ